MAGTIYATMRKYDKSLHNHSNVMRARAEKHAENIAAARGDPRQTLRVAGIRCKIYNDIAQHKAIEALEGGIPWNGQEDNVIDRFDGRALLDFYREPVKRPPREKDEEEQELDDKLNFESYRDLVKLLRRTLPEEAALVEVEKREMEERAQREYERSHPKEKNKESKPDSAFAAVGFSYAASSGSGGHHAGNDNSEDDYSGSDSDEDSSGSDSDSSEGGQSGSDKDEELGSIAKEFDIPNFRKLARRDKQEEKEREENPHNPRHPFGRPNPNPLGSRRQRRKKIRELRSKGVTDRDAYRAILKQAPAPAPLANPPAPSYRRRSSPTYDSYERRSRSRSPRRHGRSRRESAGDLPAQREYITAFGSVADAPNPEDDRRDRDRRRSPPAASRVILEASGRRDPAELAAASSSLYSGRDSGPAPSSSALKHGAPKAAAVTTKLAASGPAKAGEKKETPMERLKRLTQARLNKQITKDTQGEVAKLQAMQKEREFKAEALRKARDEQLGAELAGRYARRSRSRSRSPPPRRRSRSRSRSPYRAAHKSSHRSHRSRSPERRRSRSRSPYRRR
mmetsp:Transcript_10871/g.22667  ORF Transcript_10871/g.22667 Transcript_10871/m.22667 type:complete len:567 (-) Transcript_10871:251-1951(-)